MVMTMLMLCNPIDNLAKTAERRISCLRGLHRLWQTIKWPPSGLNFFFLRVAEGKEKLRVGGPCNNLLGKQFRPFETLRPASGKLMRALTRRGKKSEKLK